MNSSKKIEKAINEAANVSAEKWVNRLDEVGGMLMDEAVRIDARRKRALDAMREALELLQAAEEQENELLKTVKKSWSEEEIKAAKA